LTNKTNQNVLCVFGCLLGNKTVSAIIKDVLDGLDDFQADYISVTPDDYGKYKVPCWKKAAGMTAEALHIIDQKLKDVDFNAYDLVIVQGFEYGWAVNKRVKDIPCIMFNDSTPTATHRMMRQFPYYSPFWKLRSLVLEWAYRIFFRNVFSNIDHVFPQTDWCGRSMVRDFGIPQSRVSGGTIAADLDRWPVRDFADSSDEGIRLLFVGNEFQRKGGPFLLAVLERLPETAKLVIVSNDCFFDSALLPDRVRHYKNIDHDKMPEMFRSADIFVFPTYKEHFGMVQIEALSSGLPLISRDVGGVSDAVIDGYNGYLMPYKSTEDDWVKKIEFLMSHPDERARMGKNSRVLAEEKFSMEKFKSRISEAIETLCR